MAVDERRRAGLFERLAATIGEEATTTLFALLPPDGPAASGADVDRMGAALRGEMAELRTGLQGEMAQLGAELRGEMAELRAELRGEMAELRTGLQGEMAELRTGLQGEMAELRTEQRADSRLLRTELTGAITAGNAELLATFRQELNEALLRSNRTMLIGLSSTLIATVSLAAVLARFVS